MKIMFNQLALIILWMLFLSTANSRAADFDVVIYGATPGGIAAAVNASREGASVALLQEDGHIGGLTSGGLSNPDFRSFECLGGTWREFIHRVERHYAEAHGEDSRQVIDSVRGAYSEPRVARLVFEEMLAETGRVTVLLHHRLDSVETSPVPGTTERMRVRSANFIGPADSELTVTGRVFIDATYEGDLIAAAGVETIIGCESKAAYGESLAFDEPNAWVMAYNFRVCLTTDPANRIAIEKPRGYQPEKFDLLRDAITDGRVRSLRNPDPTPAVLKVRPIPNDKADFNDDPNGPISMALKNINHRWPEGDAATRQEIFEQYKLHTLSLFWFLGNDPALPESFRTEMLRWGIPKDEFADTGNWSPALYVREGRRMIGEYVFTEHDTQPAPGSVRAAIQKDSIAVADYSLNSHGVYSPEPGVNIGRHGKQVVPYGIPYGVLVPKQVDGLLAPVPVSASRVGYSALRMEPCWTALGQAAGVAAALSIREACELRELAVPKLQDRLWDLGAMTVYLSDLAPVAEIPLPAWDPPGSFPAALHDWPVSTPGFKAAQYFGTRGLFHDLVDPKSPSGERSVRVTGQWATAFPHHAIGFEEPIERPLAADWSAAVGVELAGDLIPDGQMTRRTFLQRLYDRVDPR